MDGRKTQVREIFGSAFELPVSARQEYLERACAGLPDIRAEVEELLGALERAGDYMGSPTVGGDAPARAAAATGAKVGAYTLLELIGEGGFGEVYLAEQHAPVRRRVALKIIKPGMDSKGVIARFEQERQALAMMDHPNIAKVLEAGSTPEGRPYFVMELVRGVPITQFCDEQRLSPRERLELLVPVCQAVQHAHQKGIIHRDIKPNNVMVTLHDGVAVPKVIDFGIAKATGPALTDRTVYTEFRQLIGTPAYMSPEQAEMSGLDIDTRSDIYSLGVLMYELLTGSTPFETTRLVKAGLAEMQRIIRETEPPKPSTRVSTAGVSLAAIAERRRTAPDRLGRMVRGELDWIVMKAMEKDRTRRYETANSLAMDVQRYLGGEPVLAAPPGAAYRVRKFLRRHRGPATAVGIVLGAVLLGLVGTSVGFARARSQRDRAVAAEKRQQSAAEDATRAAERATAEAERATRATYAARVAAAYGAIQSENGGEARRQLLAAPESLRGWEWKHLWFIANPWQSMRRYTDGEVSHLRVSANGRWGAFAAEGGKILVVDLSGAKTPREITTGNAKYFAACPSNDGGTVAVPQDWDGSAPTRGIDVKTGKTVWTRQERDCAGVVDGDAVLLLDEVRGEYVRVDISTGRTVDSVPQTWALLKGGEVLGVSRVLDPKATGSDALSEASAYLGVGTLAAEARTENGSALAVYQPGGSAPIRIWHPSRQGVRMVPINSDLIGFRFRADGEYLVTGVLDRMTMVSSRTEGRDRAYLFEQLVWPIREEGGGSAMGLIADDHGRVYRLPLYGGPSPWTFEAPLLIQSFGMAISADAMALVTTDWGCVTLWDSRTGEPRWRRGGWSTFLRAAAISHDGSLVAAGAELGKVRLYEARNGSVRGETKGKSGEAAMGLEFVDEGRGLIVAWSDGSMERLQTENLDVVTARTAATGTCIERTALSPDGTLVATVTMGLGKFSGQSMRLEARGGQRETGVVVRRITDLEEVSRLEMTEDPAICAAFSGDGARLAVGTKGGEILVLDPRRLEKRHSLTRIAEGAGAVAWSPDGSRVVAGTKKSLACIDARTGDIVFTSRTNADMALRFTADGGELLAMSSAGGTWLETAWPDDDTLLKRDRVKLAMEWLRLDRRNDMSGTRARAHFSDQRTRPAAVREEAAVIIDALGEQPAQANNYAMIKCIRRWTERDEDREFALELLEAAIAQTPDAPNYRLTRAELLSHLGRYDEAMKAVDEAQAMYERTPLVRVPSMDAARASVLRLSGKIDEAAAMLERAKRKAEAVQDAEMRAMQLQEIEEETRQLEREKPGTGVPGGGS